MPFHVLRTIAGRRRLKRRARAVPLQPRGPSNRRLPGDVERPGPATRSALQHIHRCPFAYNRRVLLRSIVLVSVASLSLHAQKSWGVEKTSHVDPVTRATVLEIANQGVSANLYFHFSNFTADNRYVIFSNDRSGSPQLYRVSVPEGEIIQLTHEPGVQPTTACPDPTNPRRVYYARDNSIYSIDVESFAQRKLVTLPGRGGAQPTVSKDGKTLAVGFQVDDKTWEIGVIDTTSGQYRRVLQQGFRIGHVQHSPTDPVIFYSWETSGYAPQRTWLVNTDGTGNRPFYANVEPAKWLTPLKEWITHEAWVPATGEMTMIQDRFGILMVKPSGEWRVVTKGWYWHAAASPDGKRLIADDLEGQLWLIDVATGASKLLATHVRQPKMIHNHASWDRTGRYVQFNYTHDGKQSIALIDVAAWESAR